MVHNTLRILLVEDNPGDALLLQETLDDRYPGQYAIAVAETLGAAASVLPRQAFDAILLDLSLPDCQGLESVVRLSEASPGMPILVLTSLDDEEIGLEAVRLGAQDYLLKGRADGWAIARAIRYAVERKGTEQVLRAQQEELEAKNKELFAIQRRLEAYRDRYVDLYDFAPLGYVTLDEDGYIQEINLAGAALLGQDRAELTGHPLADCVPERHKPAFLTHVRECCEGREVTTELSLIAKDGHARLVQLRSIPLVSPGEEGTFCKTAIAEIARSKEMG